MSKYREDGLPRHISMGLTADNQGPAFPHEPDFDHWGCWCGDAKCKQWKKTLGPKTAREKALVAYIRSALHGVDGTNPSDEFNWEDDSYRTINARLRVRAVRKALRPGSLFWQRLDRLG